MKNVLLVNFPKNGGVKQFSVWLDKQSKHEFEYYQFTSYKELKNKIIKNKYKRVIFCNNNINIYKLILTGSLHETEVILILHDHKLRAGASLKERILIFLYRYHIRFFTKIIIHSNVNEEKNDKIVYLKMPFHYEERHVAKEKIKLLQFGRIDDYKNIKGLVNIIKNNENFELIIAGSGHLSKKEKLDIEKKKNITLINQYINADISELLFSWCDYLCLYYSDVTQTGLIDYASKYKKGVIVSDIDEFKNVSKKYTNLVSVIPLEENEARIALNNLSELYSYELKQQIEKEAKLNYYNSVNAWDKYINELSK